jgi:hypothetical protein
MRVKIIATIIADIDVFPDDVLNSDTIADYTTQLNCDIDNAALNYLSHQLKHADIEINMTEPEFYDGIEEYSKLLNNWQSEYNERSKI